MKKFPVDKFYLVKFKKIKLSQDDFEEVFEEDSVVGYTPFLPKEGVRFLIFCKGASEGSIKMIKTRVANKVILPDSNNPRKYMFETQSGSYEVLVLDIVDSKIVEEFIKDELGSNKREEKIDKYMKSLDDKKPKIIN